MNKMKITPEAGDFGQPRVIIPAPSNLRYAHLSWSKIVTAHDGTLVLAYLSGTTHRTNGCPTVAVSKDGGKSFGEPQVLIDLHQGMEFEHSGNLALGVAVDGSIVLLAMALRSKQSSSTIMGWRSEDSGATWIRVNTGNLQKTTGSVYGHVFIVPGKGLAVTGHFREGSLLSDRGLWIAFSLDNGLSWGDPQMITEQYLAEPAFCWVNNKLIGLAKGMKGNGLGYTQFESDDYGENWRFTNPVLSIEQDPTSPSLIPDPDNPERVYAFQTERKIAGSESAPGHITLFQTRVIDLKWEKVGVIAYFPQLLNQSTVKRDFGYPWMTKCEDGTWLLVFYDGEFAGPNSLWGLTLDLNDTK
ncbi:sialidase family protein [Paenibacillus sp. FSL H8-0034]|uniref:sialidase family protein n=1 Tax=Paenibacillus sp. FSL H8-0034 TaxID=2954671 RepID=UPI0030F9E174